jgi:hypothetical protein
MLADANGDYDLADRAAELYKDVFVATRPEASYYEVNRTVTSTVTRAINSPKPKKKRKDETSLTEVVQHPVEPIVWKPASLQLDWAEYDKASSGMRKLLASSPTRAFDEALRRWRSSPLHWMRLAGFYIEHDSIVTAVRVIVL